MTSAHEYRHDLHFDKRVRVAVGVHGCEMGTADDPHQQATLLRVVAQRHQDSATLGEKNKGKKKRASTDARSCPDEHPANRQHLMTKTVIKRSVIGILFLFFFDSNWDIQRLQL